MDTTTVLHQLDEVAASWRAGREDRLTRRSLDPADFAALADAGWLRLAVPVEQGGTWTDARRSVRPLTGALRALAAADPSPTLVAAMHPAVLAYWLGSPDPDQPAWEAQRREVFATAAAGEQWGTVTSEPGSGGDVLRTRTVAAPAGEDAVDAPISGSRHRLTGDKHFGSGTGVCSYMFTTAVADGDDEPSAYLIDTRRLRNGGAVEGFTVTAPWDGVGMAATQSHAVRLDGCAAVRLAWQRPLRDLVAGAAAVNLCLFTSVVCGVVDEAVAAAGERLGPRAHDLRPLEQVEWVRATTDHWLAVQALEGMVRAVEEGDPLEALRATLRGKSAVADLAEQSLRRLTMVVGGGTYSRRSPFAAWFEDVRALGFLRPPVALAHDTLWSLSNV